ncbi:MULTISPECIES: DUF6807 family protein [unclassified Rathayibacter]|uniref:DUF6807 family protein n=1 Tax=unclassified Rathayibacter TaxID=2609250 RepID=UPI0006F6BDE3|nr:MULTISPECIES: DUF6807 family protein [unclassified Rathayibacter]KQQ05541.1 hypothetical protein ASF42_02920 [Rathayibacter sp. Leaf294]KQS13404.1 hypothetical protein ASG06_02935 [Rathayibacter sp. Leaf185]
MILQDGVAVLVTDDPGTPARDSPRPYLHPLRTPGGVVVSDLRPPDHDWHLGLSLTVSNVSIGDEPQDANFWGGVTWVTGEGYRQLDNNGSQRVLEQHGSTLSLGWFDAGGRLLLRERRRHRVERPADGVAVLGIESEWTPEVHGLHFGSPTTAGRPDAGYGGLFLRLAPAFARARVLSPSGETTADEARGADAPWLALATDAATVAIAASATNPVAPSPWFVRTDPTPMLCAAPFFHRAWPLAGPARWSWRVLLADRPLDPQQLTALLPE